MRLAIVTCIHGRPRLTRSWCQYTQRFGNIYAAVTTGDAENVATLRSVGATFAEVPNEPLGAKHNAALELACRSAWDAAILLPSDDFVNEAFIQAALQALQGGAHYVFPQTCAMYDGKTGAAFMLQKPTSGALYFGAGRLLSRAAVQAIGPLWTDAKPKGLDTDSHARILAHGFRPVTVGVGDAVPCLTDVKSGEDAQLWPFHTWQKRGRAIGGDVALGFLPEEVRHSISK